MQAKEVENAINQMKSAGATGCEKISAKMLKYSKCHVSAVLANLFYQSIALAQYPSTRKTAIVTLVYKKGCKFSLNNYRPISILPVISRVFEKILSLQLANYMDNHRLLSGIQHGFCRMRSCQIALISLTNNLFQARSSGLFSIVASLDFMKAFDCTNHDLLLAKLQSKNLSDHCIKWFGSYLKGRTQCVKYNGALSDPLPVSVGCAQGTGLGPQLFNIYIDDLLQSLPDESCVAYADDVTLVATGKSFDDARKKLQTQIDNASAWAANNCLKLNHSKSNIMFISAKVRKSNASLPPILLYGRPLSVAEQITVLGVTIDSNLDWSAKCAKVRGKINGWLSVLRRFSTSQNTCRRQQVFNAFVKPHLTYCLPVWGNTSVTDQHLFDKTLNRCSRFILNNSNINFNSQVFLSTDLCFFKYHVLISKVIAVFNVLHNECTNSLNSFVLLSDVHDRLTRSSNANKIKTKLVKRECDNKCFLYTSMKD